MKWEEDAELLKDQDDSDNSKQQQNSQDPNLQLPKKDTWQLKAELVSDPTVTQIAAQTPKWERQAQLVSKPENDTQKYPLANLEEQKSERKKIDTYMEWEIERRKGFPSTEGKIQTPPEPLYTGGEGRKQIPGNQEMQSGSVSPAQKPENERMLEFARKRLKDAWFPNVAATGVELGASVLAPIARMFGLNKEADFANHFSEAYEKAASERDQFGVLPPVVSRGLRSAGVALPSMTVVGAVAGPYGVIGSIAAQSADRALTQGKDAGLSGADLTRYVATTGMVEAIPYAVLQRFGMGGIVSKLGGQGGASAVKGVMSALKDAGVDYIEQLTPSVAAAVGHAVTDKLSGIDPNSLDPEKLSSTVQEAAAQALIMTGVVSGFHAAGKVAMPALRKVGIAHAPPEAEYRMPETKEHRNELRSAVENGTPPTRAQFNKWGLSKRALYLRAKEWRLQLILCRRKIIRLPQRFQNNMNFRVLGLMELKRNV